DAAPAPLPIFHCGAGKLARGYMNATSFNSQAAEAAGWILEHLTEVVMPRVALVTGSGLSALAEATEVAASFSTADIPHYPPSTVAGHPGRLIFGTIADTPVVVIQGRAH